MVIIALTCAFKKGDQCLAALGQVVVHPLTTAPRLDQPGPPHAVKLLRGASGTDMEPQGQFARRLRRVERFEHPRPAPAECQFQRWVSRRCLAAPQAAAPCRKAQTWTPVWCDLKPQPTNKYGGNKLNAITS